MQISSDHIIVMQPQHLFYAPINKRREAVFLRHLSPAEQLTQGTVKNSLQTLRIKPFPPSQGLSEDSSRRLLYLLGACSILITFSAATVTAFQEAASPKLERNTVWNPQYYCTDMSNHSIPRFLSYLSDPPERIIPYQNDDEALPIICAMFPILFSAFAYIGRHSLKSSFEIIHWRLTADSSAEIDAVLSQFSYTVCPNEDELPPRDMHVAFPYLSEEQLKHLNFSQLTEAKEHWPALFQQKLADSAYSKSQLAIWRIFQHILEADDSMRTEIISKKMSQKVIGSDPTFFQTLFRALKPRNDRINAIFQRILKREVLHANIATRVSERDIKEIFDRMDQGEDLLDILSFLTGYANPEIKHDPFESFLMHGRLEISDWKTCYNTYKRILELKDPSLRAWFESYLTLYIDQLSSNGEILATLAEIKADSLFLKIDTHLSQLTSPQFPSSDFAKRYGFAMKYQLPQYTLSLRKHCITTINAYNFSSPTEGHAYEEIQAMQMQLETLFADQIQAYLSALGDRVTTLLPSRPTMIVELTDQALASSNTWLLAILKNAYLSNEIYYAPLWLSCPFSVQADKDPEELLEIA